MSECTFKTTHSKFSSWECERNDLYILRCFIIRCNKNYYDDQHPTTIVPHVHLEDTYNFNFSYSNVVERDVFTNLFNIIFITVLSSASIIVAIFESAPLIAVESPSLQAMK